MTPAYPRGPPMNDMTNIHAGTPYKQGGADHIGPLRAEDEKDLTQLLFDMIQNELYLEQQKQLLVE